MTKGSIINTLLQEIPFVDLHIISVSRSVRDQEGQFEKGVRAYLVKENEQYRLQFKHTKEAEFEGIFFKDTCTDFNNGLFKFMKNKETLYIHVTEDYVDDFTNVKITVPDETDNIN